LFPTRIFRRVYANTSKGSPLRQYFVDGYARLDRRKIGNEDEAPQQLLIDIFEAVRVVAEDVVEGATPFDYPTTTHLRRSTRYTLLARMERCERKQKS
jgi:hypothetical protein